MTTPTPPLVWFGNPQAVEIRPVRNADGSPYLDPDGVEVRHRVRLDGPRWTVMPYLFGDTPGGLTQFCDMLLDPGGVWPAHSDAPRPSWVASTDDNLVAELSATLDMPIADPPTE